MPWHCGLLQVRTKRTKKYTKVNYKSYISQQQGGEEDGGKERSGEERKGVRENGSIGKEMYSIT
jgi:hypothetical protein